MIRLGKLSDIDQILSLTKACSLELIQKGINQWDEDYPSRSVILSDIEKETLFVLLKQEEIVGIVVLNEKQDDEYQQIKWKSGEHANFLVVHRLAVHPYHQGKGFARELMDYAENFASKNKYDSIRLDTFSLNKKNQTFYLKRKYDFLGEVMLPYKKNISYYCYELLLKNDLKKT